MFAPGKQISPFLRLVRPLGEGGMGRVWVAEHQTLATEVAVKLLNPAFAEDAQWLARFRREAQAVAKIDSAHVVRVFDHGVTTEGIPFIVMELLRGEDLRQRLERTRGLALDETVAILTQICRALTRAHELHIVHRDVKPENIFLTREGTELFVKILDFGIAKQATAAGAEVTDDQFVFGTPYYMSPERVMNTGRIDHRADLWALAVVVYQMLTGDRPFVGPTQGALYVRINSAIYERPSRLRPELPLAVDEWFRIALNRNIDARFGSAADMAEAFRVATEGRKDAPARASRDELATDSARLRTAVTAAYTVPVPKRRSTWLISALLLLALIGVLLARAWSEPSERERRFDAPSASQLPEKPVELPAGSTVSVPASAPRDATNGQPDVGPAAQVASAAPAPAHLPSGAIKRRGASAGSAHSPSVPASAQQRSIKDRGF
jgi:serine/threonine-protein kinase